MHFKMSSAICFNLDQSKRLSSGNGLTHSKVLWQDKLSDVIVRSLNSLLKVENVNLSKFKAFADGFTDVAQIMQFIFDKIENMWENEKTLDISIFFFSHNVFWTVFC